jgi:hypothetical protein
MLMIHRIGMLVGCLFISQTVFGQQREIDELAGTLSLQFSQANRRVVAVAHFTNDDGFDDRFSRFLTSRLTTGLALEAVRVEHGFKVVDRMKTDAVLKELDLQYAKPFDAATFARFGAGVGAETIIAGDFRVTTNKISINCLAMNMSMELVGGKVFEIPRTAEVNELLGNATTASGDARPTNAPSGSAVGVVTNETASNGTRAGSAATGHLVTVRFTPRNRSEGLQRLTLAVNGQVVGDIVFAPNPARLEVTGPPGEWHLDYQLVGVDRITKHSYRAQFGREFFVEGSGAFLIDAYDNPSQGALSVNIVRDDSPFR